MFLLLRATLLLFQVLSRVRMFVTAVAVAVVLGDRQTMMTTVVVVVVVVELVAILQYLLLARMP
jgi:hypothetical protein